MEYTFEKFEGSSITDEMLVDAAHLFSSHYGIWGPLTGAKQGHRVRMSARVLREQCLPSSTTAHNVYVRVRSGDTLIGNVCATRWMYEGKSMCWVTQLCVSLEFRRKGLATKLLRALKEGEQDYGFGILSSHPAAILATLRAFGHGAEGIDLGMTEKCAKSIMQSCPVEYVRTAKLRGYIFGDNDGTVSCADTGFYVDHQEPMAAMQTLRERGIEWPLGELPDGHEFLVLAKG